MSDLFIYQLGQLFLQGIPQGGIHPLGQGVVRLSVAADHQPPAVAGIELRELQQGGAGQLGNIDIQLLVQAELQPGLQDMAAALLPAQGRAQGGRLRGHLLLQLVVETEQPLVERLFLAIGALQLFVLLVERPHLGRDGAGHLLQQLAHLVVLDKAQRCLLLLVVALAIAAHQRGQ